MRVVLLFFLLFSYLFGAMIDIELNGVYNTKGKIYIGLYNKKEGFTLFDSVYKSKVIILNSNNLKISFENIPNGLYALSLFHDTNNNKILDKNFFGIPKEGYGFSNNPKVFGKSSFEDAKFELNDYKRITIEVKY